MTNIADEQIDRAWWVLVRVAHEGTVDSALHFKAIRMALCDFLQKRGRLASAPESFEVSSVDLIQTWETLVAAEEEIGDEGLSLSFAIVRDNLIGILNKWRRD